MSYPESARVFVGGVTEHTTQEDLTSQVCPAAWCPGMRCGNAPPQISFILHLENSKASMSAPNVWAGRELIMRVVFCSLTSSDLLRKCG
jgi:hypothetical protein